MEVLDDIHYDLRDEGNDGNYHTYCIFDYDGQRNNIEKRTRMKVYEAYNKPDIYPWLI
jgi:hypothetical protein